MFIYLGHKGDGPHGHCDLEVMMKDIANIALAEVGKSDKEPYFLDPDDFINELVAEFITTA